jgi:hypothetical protein
MTIFNKIPYLLYILLAVVYLGCGYMIGFHQGYKTGQRNYISYIEKLLDESEVKKISNEK